MRQLHSIYPQFPELSPNYAVIAVCEWSRRQLAVKAGNNAKASCGGTQVGNAYRIYNIRQYMSYEIATTNTRQCFLRRCTSIARTRVIATTTTLLERGSGLYSLAGTPVPVLPYFERG